MKTSTSQNETEILDYYYQEVSNLGMYVAYGISYVGGETYRAEDSCSRVLQAYGGEKVEVMVMANFLTLSFEYGGKAYHAQKRIPAQTNSMGRLDELNQLIREIVRDKPEPSLAINQIKTIIERPSHTLLQDVLITSSIGFSFALMLGGSFLAALMTFVIDGIVRAGLEPLYKQKTNHMFINITGGFLVTLLAGISHYVGLGHEQAIITTSAFMFLFPGVSLVNSIRDLLASDYLAGATKLIQTILVALGIAIGSGIGLSLLNSF